MKTKIKSIFALSALTLAGNLAASFSAHAVPIINFKLQRPPAAAAACAPNARGAVRVTTLGDVEVMDVTIEGLIPNTDYDAFIIQVPNAPFGMSWYQGDIHTNSSGKGSARYIGRFNKETFVVAPNVAPAPFIHSTDAVANLATPPIHTYHVGVWFNSPADALRAGCPGTVTPFNGDHTAGVQVLNTSQFLDTAGPLKNLAP